MGDGQQEERVVESRDAFAQNWATCNDLVQFRAARESATQVPAFSDPYTRAERDAWLQTFQRPVLLRQEHKTELVTVYAFQAETHQVLKRAAEAAEAAALAGTPVPPEPAQQLRAELDRCKDALQFIAEAQLQHDGEQVAVWSSDLAHPERRFRRNGNAVTMEVDCLPTLRAMHAELEGAYPDHVYVVRVFSGTQVTAVPWAGFPAEKKSIDFLHVVLVPRAAYQQGPRDLPLADVIKALHFEQIAPTK